MVYKYRSSRSLACSVEALSCGRRSFRVDIMAKLSRSGGKTRSARDPECCFSYTYTEDSMKHFSDRHSDFTCYFSTFCKVWQIAGRKFIYQMTKGHHGEASAERREDPVRSGARARPDLVPEFVHAPRTGSKRKILDASLSPESICPDSIRDAFRPGLFTLPSAFS